MIEIPYKLEPIQKMYYGYIQQDGIYQTLDLVITDEYSEKFSDYYKNDQQWYLAAQSQSLKEVIQKLWFAFSYHGTSGNPVNIKIRLEDDYIIDFSTIKKMFAEEILK